MKRIIIGLSLTIASMSVYAGWSRIYGGDGRDEGRDVIQIPDGGFLVVGSTSSFGTGGSDVWLLRVGEYGDTVWSRTYGTEADEVGERIKAADDGNYLIFAGNWILKVDGIGDTLWTLTLDKSGYIMTGQEAEDLFLARYDEQGTRLWSRTFGTEWEDRAGCVLVTPDGDYVVAGTRGVFQHFYLGSAWVIKTDSSGNMLWEYVDEVDMAADRSWANHMCQTADGGYLVAGGYHHDDVSILSSGLFIFHLSSDGEMQWETIYRNYTKDQGYEVKETSEGCNVAVGRIRKVGYEDHDLWIIKTTNEGDSIWARIYGTDGFDCGYAVKETTDGGFIITGYTNRGFETSDLWLIRTDSEGDTTAIVENTSQPQPDWYVSYPVGREIVLGYENRPQGFRAKVFDASGRRVDVLNSSQTSGTITWGKCYGPGVYFIREVSASTARRVVIIR